MFPGDARNLEGDSDSITVAVQQKEHPLFTINSSDPIITAGQSVTISGTLYSSGSTPEQSTSVGLYGAKPGDTMKLLDTMTTGSDGTYGFTQQPDPQHRLSRCDDFEASPGDRKAVRGRAGHRDD